MAVFEAKMMLISKFPPAAPMIRLDFSKPTELITAAGYIVEKLETYKTAVAGNWRGFNIYMLCYINPQIQKHRLMVCIGIEPP